MECELILGQVRLGFVYVKEGLDVFQSTAQCLCFWFHKCQKMKYFKVILDPLSFEPKWSKEKNEVHEIVSKSIIQ